MIEALGHRFADFKSEEMICRTCGFVIWRVKSAGEAEEAVRDLKDGNPAIYCGKAWHKQVMP